MHFFIKTLFLVVFTLHSACAEDSDKKRQNDNYLFALSWSPTYCLLQDDAHKNHAQCDNKNKKYRMIVHGLWPQPRKEINSPKDHLKYCADSPKKVPAQIVSDMFDIAPSTGLIQHTWRKHGTCSGLSQKEYFGKTKDLFDTLHVKDYLGDISSGKIMLANQIRQDIKSHTDILEDDNFILVCRGRMLREVRICLNKDFTPRPCSLDEKRQECRVYKIYVPFVR